MQEKQPEPQPAKKPSVAKTLPRHIVPEPRKWRIPERLVVPLNYSELEERLLAQRGQGQLTSAQEDALNVLVSIDREFREQRSRAPGFEVLACYTVAKQLGRPSLRCDSTVRSMASVVEGFSLQTLGWNLASPGIEAALQEAVDSVGRIEPANGSHNRYVGTGFLISESRDGDCGVVMTNWHVVREMQNGSADWSQRGGKIYFTTQFHVDFDGSENRIAERRARVLNARAHPAPSAVGGSRLDIALLDVDLTPVRSNLSGRPALSVAPIKSNYDMKHSRESDCPVIVIGFPLRTGKLGVHGGVDWTKLIEDIFGNDFGFKRASPGLMTHPVGHVEPSLDPMKWTVGHDASTLKGSSGSPVISADGSGAFAVHFSGADLQVNYAHSLHDSQLEIKKMSG